MKNNSSKDLVKSKWGAYVFTLLTVWVVIMLVIACVITAWVNFFHHYPQPTLLISILILAGIVGFIRNEREFRDIRSF